MVDADLADAGGSPEYLGAVNPPAQVGCVVVEKPDTFVGPGAHAQQFTKNGLTGVAGADNQDPVRIAQSLSVNVLVIESHQNPGAGYESDGGRPVQREHGRLS